MAKEQTKEQTKVANHAWSKGRVSFRNGKSIEDCPWDDEIRVFHYRQGWLFEKRLTNKVAARRSLYG